MLNEPFFVPHFPTDTPWVYHALVSFFRFVLAIFFSRIVIENSSRFPRDGQPTILLVNHSNSLTDALVVMAAVPRHSRRMLRMTAKATHFQRRTFSSWLIHSAGSVPLHRAQDLPPGSSLDNAHARNLLINALALNGDAVCIFPEGISRYHPQLAPLKTGAARIASDVLRLPTLAAGFQLHLVTCSITYLHPQNFRSDVLVSFHHPITLAPGPLQPLASDDDRARKEAILALTSTLSEQLRSGTLDSPSWLLIRAANMARTIYAPFGTRIGLGPHVRLTQRFVDAFAGKCPARSSVQEESNAALVQDLLKYQSRLYELGIKDDRVANSRLVKRRVIVKRLLFRLLGACFLASICVPGLTLWAPTFGVTRYFAQKQRRKGPAWDTFDEVTQTKMLWGLASGVVTYLMAMMITFPFILITSWGIPLLMWLTLRWLEDLVATLRAARSLHKMLTLGQRELDELRRRRLELKKKVLEVAVDQCDLAHDSEALLNPAACSALPSRTSGGGTLAVAENDSELVIKNGRLSRFGYFSLRRRRKKDYNEVLRLWDLIDR